MFCDILHLELNFSCSIVWNFHLLFYSIQLFNDFDILKRFFSSQPPSGSHVGSLGVRGDSANSSTDGSQRPENALDALLDELQTFSKPHPSTVTTQMPQVSFPDPEPPTVPVKGIPPSHSSGYFNHPPTMSEIGRKGSMDSAAFLPGQNLTVSTATGSLRRLHSYPSGSDTDNSPPIQPLQRLQVDSSKKPPIPERNAELLQHITSGRRIPPPPPPRTSSKSPLASPTSPNLPPRSPHIQDKPQTQFESATQNLGLGTLRRNLANKSNLKDKAQTLPRNTGSSLQIPSDSDPISASNSSSCESVNSQDGSKKATRKEELEQRHQELLKKQKALQEQYARLQQLQRGNNTLTVIPPAPEQLLKKTGSESNLLQKMGLHLATTTMTGSLTHLPNPSSKSVEGDTDSNPSNNTTTASTTATTTTTTTTNKVYETDIL